MTGLRVTNGNFGVLGEALLFRSTGSFFMLARCSFYVLIACCYKKITRQIDMEMAPDRELIVNWLFRSEYEVDFLDINLKIKMKSSSI